jgi:hypothetical protein
MNQHIHCLVHDCHYWGQGNKCHANEIMVVSDQFGKNNPDTVDAQMASQLESGAAGTCMSTCCKTFVKKGSDTTTVDGVVRM